MNDMQIKQAMYSAVIQGNLSDVSLLIRQYPNAVSMTTPFGTWLHLAARYGNIPLMGIFLSNGVNINVKGGIMGGNALNYAASNGRLEAVKFLHSRGAEFDTSDPTRNPLFAAINEGSEEVARFLIENGINTSVKYSGENMKNTDALAYAMQRGMRNIARLLNGGIEAQIIRKAVDESKLSRTDTEMISRAINAGEDLLGIKTTPGIEAQRIITEFINYNFKQGSKSTRDKYDPIALGALWGQRIVDECGWEWIKIHDNGVDSLCITDAGRKYVIFTLYYFTRISHDGTAGEVLPPMALHGCIVEGHLPAANDGDYHSLT